jgi:hypothetical protein
MSLGNVITLTETAVNRALPKIEAGLHKYCWIQDNFQQCDVRRDQNFQRRYSGFYKVRRGSEWRRQYYELMQMSKGQKITYPQALRAMIDRTNRIEASFTSKLIATLDATKPVVDKFVLNNFGLHLPFHYAANREPKTIQVYDELCRKYEDLMGHPIAGMICDKFVQMYPWANITDLKKVDLVLWQTRK